MSYSLAELAERFNLQLSGDGDLRIEGIASLTSARNGQLSFLADKSYARQLSGSQASALVLHESFVEQWGHAALISRNPQADFARIAALFDPHQRPSAGIHPSAFVDPTATLGDGVHIGANAVIGARCQIADDVVIGAGCVIGNEASIGASSWLTANVTLFERVKIGCRAHIQPGAAIGGRGFGLAPDDGRWVEVPQVASVRIGDDVEIGANTTIDRGALSDTVIEDGVKIDNQVQIGHNCHIGEATVIAGCAGIAGSVRIGKRCQIAGGVGMSGHIELADDVVITGFSLVSSSITEAGVYSSGIPVTKATQWRRQVARIRGIDELHKRVNRLDKNQGST